MALAPSTTTYTFTSVYDSATASDFNGSKTLAQIGITALDTVTITGGNLVLGPGTTGNGFIHNRALFAPVLKYGRVIAEYVMPTGFYSGVFGRAGTGNDYFTIALSDGTAEVYSNDTGSGADAQTRVTHASFSIPAGHLVRQTLDILPDIGGTTRLRLLIEDLTAATSLTSSTITDTRGLLGAGQWGVNNQSASGGTAYSRVAIFSASGAVDIAPGTATLVVPDGDSITAGATPVSDLSASDVSYPAALARSLDATFTVMNAGVPGRLTTDVLHYFPTEVGRKYSTAYTTAIMPLLIGANDIGTTQDSAQTIYNRIQAIHAAAKAGGYKTIAIPPWRAIYSGDVRAAGGYNQCVDQLHALLLAGWQTFADGFADPSADSRFADPSTNPLLGDHLHPNTTGAIFVAGVVKSAVLSILPPNVSVANFSADGRTLTVGLSSPITNAAATDFVLSNAAGFSVSSLSNDGLTLTLTLRRRVFVGENPTLTYAGTSIVGTNQKPVQPFTALAVTNNSTRRAFGPPAYLNVAYPGFTWPIVAGATGYRLYQNGILVYDTVNAAGVNTATSFTDPAATDGRPIDQPTFTVSAYDGTGEGPQSGTPDGTAAALFTQGVTSVTLTDNAVVNGQTVRLSGLQRVVVNDVRYDVPVGVAVMLPNSIKSVLQNANLIA